MKTEQEKKSSVEKAATAVECPELRNAIRNFSGFSRRTQFFSGGGMFFRLPGISGPRTDPDPDPDPERELQKKLMT